MYCEKCGMSVPDGAIVCDVCGAVITQSENVTPVENKEEIYAAAKQFQRPSIPEPEEKPQKRELPFLGFIGALVGAAIGGTSIILFSQAGYIASISGLILAVCTIKGYKLLGRRISKKGALICAILILVTPYIADRLDWAISIYQAFADEGATLARAFAVVPDFLKEGYIQKDVYIKNLLMVYAFAALGALGTLQDLFKK